MGKIIIICLILICSLYIYGFFHPEKIIVDKVEIIAPKGMVINSIKFKTLNDFFILPFYYKKKYTLNNEEKEISFTMLNSIFNKHKILSFTVKKTSTIAFYNFIKNISKEKDLKQEKLLKKYHVYTNYKNLTYTYYIHYHHLFIIIFSNQNLINELKNILK